VGRPIEDPLPVGGEEGAGGPPLPRRQEPHIGPVGFIRKIWSQLVGGRVDWKTIFVPSAEK